MRHYCLVLSEVKKSGAVPPSTPNSGTYFGGGYSYFDRQFRQSNLGIRTSVIFFVILTYHFISFYGKIKYVTILKSLDFAALLSYPNLSDSPNPGTHIGYSYSNMKPKMSAAPGSPTWVLSLWSLSCISTIYIITPKIWSTWIKGVMEYLSPLLLVSDWISYNLLLLEIIK